MTRPTTAAATAPLLTVLAGGGARAVLRVYVPRSGRALRAGITPVELPEEWELPAHLLADSREARRFARERSGLATVA